jgi:L-ribulokinase
VNQFALGLDFGTESARAVLVEVGSGETISTKTHRYSDGVIDEQLPGKDEKLPPDWALQNPDDWLASLQGIIHQIFQESQVDPKSVIGVGVDFTSSTLVPTLSDSTALCTLEAHRDQPHAWPKLWKHHAAKPQSDKVNELAIQRKEAWITRYGGKISSEWLIPKALEILEGSPEIYSTMDRFVEGADWITWQLTGQLARNACCAGYKATWHKHEGFPSEAFLAALHPELTNLYSEKLTGPIVPPGTKVGTLTEGWAKRLGLQTGTAVAAGIIDAHAAVIGGGVSSPGAMFMIMGTSTCHMLLAEEEILVEGISGVVEDGIVPGFFAYEAGQVSAGDIFSWFIKNNTPSTYQEEAASRGISLHDLFSEKAGILQSGESGLVALDWWNGCRTPLVDSDLNGMVIGYSLNTSPEEIYRALIESTAFGTRLIVELFRKKGIPISKIRAGGGLTKNNLLLQIYADILGIPIEITASEQVSAQGAAILGAFAGGAYESVADAIESMAAKPSRAIVPDDRNFGVYSSLYDEYRRLVELFGRDPQSVMKRLREIRAAVSLPHSRKD